MIEERQSMQCCKSVRYKLQSPSNTSSLHSTTPSGFFVCRVISLLHLQCAHFLHHGLQIIRSLRSEPCNFLDIPRRHLILFQSFRPLSCKCPRSHCKSHILGSIHKFQNRRWCMVCLQWLDPQYSRVAARSFGISFSQWSKQLWKELMRCLIPCQTF